MKKILFTVLMLAGAMLGPAVGAQNLLTNPGFETWDAGLPTGWLAETNAIITQHTSPDPVYEGTYSVGVASPSASNLGIYQDIPVTEGNQYELSMYVYSTSGTGNAGLGIYVSWLDSGGGSAGGSSNYYNTTVGAWELLTSGAITAPATAVTARCRVRCYASTTLGGYADAASFTAAGATTPTPSPTAGTPEPTATPVALTIYDVQYTTDPSGVSPYNGQVVTVTGIVTACVSGNRNMFIQDGDGAWNGVLLYSPPGGWTGYNEGDELQVTGEVYEYQGKTEIQYITNITILSTGNPLPNFVTLSTLDVNAEQYEGVLVRTENVTVVAEPDTYNEWQINDGTGICLVDDLFYEHPAVLNDVYDWVQGPLDFYTNTNSYFRIEPRYPADIDAVPPPTATPSATPSPAPACDTEILVNGNMETWSAGAGGPPNNWTSTSAAFTLTQDGVVFFDGDYSTLMTKTVSQSHTMEQILTYEVKPETQYSLSVRVLDNDPDGYARAWVVYYDSANEYIETSTLSQTSVDDPAWQELLTVDDSPAGAVYGRVRIRVYNESGNTNEVTINADAATLVEPCTQLPTSTPSGPTATPTGGPIPTTGPLGIGLMLLALGGLLSFSSLRRKN